MLRAIVSRKIQVLWEENNIDFEKCFDLIEEAAKASINDIKSISLSPATATYVECYGLDEEEVVIKLTLESEESQLSGNKLNSQNDSSTFLKELNWRFERSVQEYLDDHSDTSIEFINDEGMNVIHAFDETSSDFLSA